MRDYAAEFRACAAEARRVLGEVSEPQCRWRPPGGGWSVADCLAHLVATTDAYLPVMRAAVEQAARRGWHGTGPFRLGLVGGWFARFLEPPPARRVKAPRIFRPPVEVGPDTVRQAYFERNGLLTRLALDAEGLDLARARIVSPVSRVLRLNLAAAFAVLAAHERRHLWQAANVRRSPDFPPPG